MTSQTASTGRRRRRRQRAPDAPSFASCFLSPPSDKSHKTQPTLVIFSQPLFIVLNGHNQDG